MLAVDMSGILDIPLLIICAWSAEVDAEMLIVLTFSHIILLTEESNVATVIFGSLTLAQCPVSLQ